MCLGGGKSRQKKKDMKTKDKKEEKEKRKKISTPEEGVSKVDKNEHRKSSPPSPPRQICPF